jgi:large subunit ribosomal protein L35
MPKQKSHKGLSKRVKVTAKGKVKYKRSFGSHIMRSKNAKRRRRIGTDDVLSGSVADKIKVYMNR